MERWRRIQGDGDVDGLFRADVAILYKHSPTCGVSMAALGEIKAFLDRCPDAVVYIVDVLAQRELSRRIASRTGIRHESPQVILVQRGTARWAESHYGITLDALVKEFQAVRREDRQDR